MTFRESLMKKILFVLMLGLVGCATPQRNQVFLTFESVPTGAMLYEGQKALGLAPQEKIFSYNGVPTTMPTTTTMPITAVWASGASVTRTFNVTLGTSQIATFSRPPNAPNLDKDLMFAERLRQADAASWAELARAFQLPPSVTTNCTKIGTTTNCVSR